MASNIFLFLLLSLLLCLSMQLNCISAIQNRLFTGDLTSHLPGNKIGSPRKFGCLNGFYCFSDIMQYYTYSDAVAKLKSCDCSPQYNMSNVTCSIPAIKKANSGLSSIFNKNILVSNQKFDIQSVTFIFSQEIIYIGQNRFYQWILSSVSPIPITATS